MSEQSTPVATAHVTAPYGPLADALKIAEFGTVCATGPAQSAVLIEADDTGLTLRTHDWETAVSVTVPTASVTQPGASLLPLAQLTKSLKAMMAGETKATAARTTVTLAGDLLATDHLTVPVAALPVGEFTPAKQPAPVAAHLDAQDLYRQLQRVIPAACTDDTLPTLTAVQMTLEGHTLTLSATDRYRFAVADVPATPNPDHPATAEHPLTALIPASVLTRIAKHLKTQTGPVAIAFGTPELTLTVGDTTFTIQPREGTLPGCAALFSATVDTSLTLERATAQRALKKCAALIAASGERGSPVTLRWDETGTLTLAPRIGEPDDLARIKGMPLTFATLTGPTPTGRELHANPAFLADALAAFDATDTLTLHLQDPKEGSTTMRPLLLTTNPSPTGGDYRHLLMPVRPS
ncbi:DNA polymerase III subunit beta family protein [Streptomyces rubiginosohelvolus]|uniref:DNA polymerase III subunit beta family protein n=1 Tax=Streptomyces rubiginosohelvolus TaxID=67362 RepID=UPI0036E9CABD